MIFQTLEVRKFGTNVSIRELETEFYHLSKQGMQISDIFNSGNYTAINSFLSERVTEHSDDATKVD